MKILWVVLGTLVCLGPVQGSAQRAGPGRAAPASRVVDAWVSFEDKGIRTKEELDAAYVALEATFHPRALERRRQHRTRPGLFDELDLPLEPSYLESVAGTGADLKIQSRWLNGVSVLATRDQLVAIEDFPFVAEVTDIHPHVPKGERQGRIPVDPDIQGKPGPGTDPVYGWSGPQVAQLGLVPLHEAGYTGDGVRIAVIDTGFLLDHRAFTDPRNPIEVVGQWDFVDNDGVVTPEPGDYPDQHEHGTVILGTMAANRPGEMVGSAPDAEFLLLKAEDAATEYFLEEKWFAAALEYAESHGADLVTSSVVLYTGYDPSQVDGRTSVMAKAWNLAIENGVLGFQGGGNAGHDDDPLSHNLLPPAGAPGVITVGAVGADGEVAQFSSDGLLVEGTFKPELLAWGRNTYSVSPYDPGRYTTSNGTSLATPLLAGAVACLLQAKPDWTPSELKTALRRSGDYYRTNGRPDPLFVHGFGIPDLAEAAGLRELPPTPATW